MRARLVAAAVCAVVLLAACGGDDDSSTSASNTPTTAKTPASTIPDTGKVDAMVSVDGRDVHIVCDGAGMPVVMIELGLGQSAAAWNGTQTELAATHRTCVYERPGAGRTEPVDGPRTSQVIADELADLLDAAGIATPIVLVSHSIGGMHAEAFAQRYPKDVAGLVFVDPRTAEYEAGYRKLLSPEELASDDAQAKQAAKSEPFGAEIASALDSAKAVDAAGDLPDVPTVVLTAGLRESMQDPEDDALWVGSQERLAKQSSHGRRTVVDGAEHEIWRTHSAVVVDAVKEVIAAISS